jgi:hypothetical protein
MKPEPRIPAPIRPIACSVATCVWIPILCASAQTQPVEPPFTNSPGMRFLSVPGTEARLSVWETRVSDYRTVVDDTERPWSSPSFEQGPDHPAVNVSWLDVRAFCLWLTARECKAGLIPGHFA